MMENALSMGVYQMWHNAFALQIIETVFFSWLAVAVMMPYFLKWIQKSSLISPHREDAPDRHQQKAGTPTMGGAIVFLSMIATCLVFLPWKECPLFWAFVLLILGLIGIGWYDDYLKLTHQTSKGLSSRLKFLGQWVVAGVFMTYIWFIQPAGEQTTLLTFPGLGSVDLGWGIIPWGMLLITGSSNAVNLTDGLDGLASMVALTVLFGLGILLLSSSETVFFGEATMLLSGSMTISVFIMIAALSGALLGFLWFNVHPARIFLGDVGSLTIGGVLAALAIVIRQEVLFGVMSGVFVAETLSVIIQVASFKLRKKRVFKMSPIHHHFELSGWSETSIVFRFWMISVFFVLIALWWMWSV